MSTSQLIFLIQITLVLFHLFDFGVVIVDSAPLSTVAITSVSNQTVVCGLVIKDSGSSGNRYTLNCTSLLKRGQEENYPSGNSAFYAAVAAGDGFLCGLSNTPDFNVSIMRWWELPAASTGNQSTTTVKRLYRGPLMVGLSAGHSHVCGITGDNRTLQCWRWEGFSPPALTNLIDVAVGRGFVCVVMESGSISCHSDNKENGAGVVGSEPSGNFSIVAAGDRHACGLTTFGRMNCWGVGAPILQNTTTTVQYTSLALGENRTCALCDNDTVSCWGEGGFGLPAKLKSVPFISISGRGRVFCGVAKANYTLFCWGIDGDGFSSNYSTVFDGVLPGSCVSTCSDNPIEGSGSICPPGTTICEIQSSPPALPSPPPTIAPQPTKPDDDGDNDGSSRNKKKLTYLVVGTIGLSVGVSLVFGFLYFRYCKGKLRCQKIHDSGPLDEIQPPIDMPGLRVYTKNRETEPTLDRRLTELISKGHSSTVETFSFQMLFEVTNGFSDDKKIGKGSFGSVYRAVLDDGREVAIKRADRPHSGSDIAGQLRCKEKEVAFLAELALLSRVNHRNLVRLLGFSREEAELILVYDYVQNGTLHDHLHKLTNSPISSWKTRIKLALDAARGIEYLHRYAVPAIIHRDIKSSNILIDDVWTAKVSDFGLCLVNSDVTNGPSAIIPLQAAGTVGYMDPEYYRTRCLTTKSDVYSFGVVLLELLTGCKAIHPDGTLEGSFHGDLRNVVDFAVPHIDDDNVQNVLDQKLPTPRPSEIEAVQELGYLAADCVRPEGEDRPDMKEVVNGLEAALEICTGAPMIRSVTVHSV